MADNDQEVKMMSNFLSSLVKEMREVMKTGGPSPYNDMNASGESSSMIRFEVKSTPEAVIGVLYGPSHITYLERGRGPGKAPPRDSIRKWLDDKGIVPRDGISKDSLAFLIQRKIRMEGTRLHQSGQKSGILSKTLRDEGQLQKFFNEVTQWERLKVKLLLREPLKEITI